MKELLCLPIDELERRCKHNGLSLCGGREIMVARLLNLEEAERQRGYDPKDELRFRHRETGRFAGDNCNLDIDNDSSREVREPLAAFGRNVHCEEAIEVYNISSSVDLVPSLVIPQSEMRAFTDQNEKSEHLLPVSKWARDDNSEDEDNKESQGLALSYSSSSSENGNFNHAKAAEPGVMTQSDGSGISEEHRYVLTIFCWK